MEIKLTAKEAHELFADVGQLFPEKKRETERQFYLIQRATRYSGQPSVRNRLGLSFDYRVVLSLSLALSVARGNAFKRKQTYQNSACLTLPLSVKTTRLRFGP